MRFRFARYLAVPLAVGALLLAGCTAPGGGTPEPSNGANKQRVAVLLDGAIDDQAWNQSCYDGIKKMKAEGFDVAFTETVPFAAQLETFRNYAQQDYDLIIGAGGDFTDSAKSAAGEFPNVNFVVINGAFTGKNLGSTTLNYFEMGYLAGSFASGLTATKSLGFVGGVNIPIVGQALNGYKAGAQAFDPAIQVQSTITGDWADVDKAREASLAMIGERADVLWYVIDAAQVGIMSAAEDRGVFAIASYSDLTKIAPTAQMGQVTVNIGDVLVRVAKNPPKDAKEILGVKDGVLGLKPGTNAPAAAQENLKKALDDLKAGTVVEPK